MIAEHNNRQCLVEIRDLAKRLATSFGIDLHRVREPLVAIHMLVTQSNKHVHTTIHTSVPLPFDLQ